MDSTPQLANDAQRWSFRPDGPWTVREPDLRWRVGIDRLRARTRSGVVAMTRPPRIPPIGRVVRTSVILGGAVAAWRFGAGRHGGSRSRATLSHNLRLAFNRLGPTYIKLGQIVSAGEGVFPPELVGEFRLLRDRVPAEAFEVVRATVEEDLGRPLEEVFAEFDSEPIAAASIAQVHGAQLRTGERVVVKVQRSAVSRTVEADLAALAWLAPHLVGRIHVAALANPPALIELFGETIAEELDFRLEAQNMLDVGEVLAARGQRQVVVPRPHPTLVTRRVLVMERMDGYAFSDADGMRADGIDTEEVVRAGMIAFLEGALLHGVFHGDLHAGNLVVLPGPQPVTALLDHGITGRLDEPSRRAFLRLMLAGTTNDVRTQVRSLCELGALPLDTDIEAVICDLGLDGPAKDPTAMTPDQLLAEVRAITKALLGYGARLPKELMLFIKDLMFLDAALASLAPNLDIFATITEIATYFATQHGARLASEIGFDAAVTPVDLSGLKASMGLEPGAPALTYAELTERRKLIAKRMEHHRRGLRRR